MFKSRCPNQHKYVEQGVICSSFLEGLQGYWICRFRLRAYQSLTPGVELVHKLLRAFDDQHEREGVFPALEIGDSTDGVFGVVGQREHLSDWQGFFSLVSLEMSSS